MAATSGSIAFRLTILGLAILPAACGPLVAEVDPAPRCLVPDRLLATELDLPRTKARLRAGEPLHIVALGSSSTAGAGASRRELAYPALLERELARRFPESKIRVVNAGLNGDTATGMLARLHQDLLATNPDLVIWQSGTNSALRREDAEAFRLVLDAGVARLRERDIDIVLMTPQHAPRFDARRNHMAFVRAMSGVADAHRVPMFPRYQIMKYWRESGRFEFAAMVSSDGLHMNDLSYGCIAELLAEQIERIVAK